MKTTRNTLTILVGVSLFLASFSYASAFTFRTRTLPAGFTVGSSNGGATSGNGGNGGNGGIGGFVKSGNVVSNATTVNALNTTVVRIGR